MQTADFWIEKLELIAHPEGGWFRESYRSQEVIPQEALPERFSGERSFSTAIYFLLTAKTFSAFHRIKQDEMWHFYDGAPLTLYIIDKTGRRTDVVLGHDVQNGEQLQVVVKAGSLFAASVHSGFTLSGCTVAPGFDFADFEMPARPELVRQYPQHQTLIERFTGE